MIAIAFTHTLNSAIGASPLSAALPAITPTLGEAGPGHFGFWLGKSLGATEQSGHTEWLFMFIMWVCIITFAVMMLGLAWLMFKYRRSAQKTNYQVSMSHNTLLELGWSVVPFLVMVPIFWWGFTGYVEKLSAPSESEDIYITGKKWNWSIKYKSGVSAKGQGNITKSQEIVPEFVVPAGRSVKLSMTSQDVLHAFYIPDFRIKMDVIPNRHTSMWFKALEPGVHKVQCAEYCGEFHSEMGAVLRVVPIAEYKATLAKWGEIDVEDSIQIAGKGLWAIKGCNSCHALDGAKGTGPSWKGIWGQVHKFTDGGSAKVEDDYVRESIVYPSKHIVEGYTNQMPSYAGQLKDDEIWVLTRFIQSLGDTSFESMSSMKMKDLPMDMVPETIQKKMKK